MSEISGSHSNADKDTDWYVDTNISE